MAKQIIIEDCEEDCPFEWTQPKHRDGGSHTYRCQHPDLDAPWTGKVIASEDEYDGIPESCPLKDLEEV